MLQFSTLKMGNQFVISDPKNHSNFHVNQLIIFKRLGLRKK